jgi:hypothetical protein
MCAGRLAERGRGGVVHGRAAAAAQAGRAARAGADGPFLAGWPGATG